MPVCTKCQSQFPNAIKIEGKPRNLQHRKYCLECSPFGQHNTKQIHVETNSTERICPCCQTTKPLDEFYTRRRTTNRYKATEPSPYCKLCTNIQTTKRQQANKVRAVEYMGGQCVDCGYNRCIAALEFHHLNPASKDPTINWALGKFDKFKSELDKCVLLCCRCHRERHHLLAPEGFGPSSTA